MAGSTRGSPSTCNHVDVLSAQSKEPALRLASVRDRCPDGSLASARDQPRPSSSRPAGRLRRRLMGGRALHGIRSHRSEMRLAGQPAAGGGDGGSAEGDVRSRGGRSPFHRARHPDRTHVARHGDVDPARRGSRRGPLGISGRREETLRPTTSISENDELLIGRRHLRGHERWHQFVRSCLGT